MKFILEDDIKEIKEMVHAFVEKEIKPIAHDIDQNHKYPAKIIADMAGMGLLGIYVPEQYGGTGMSHLAYTVSMEEISRWCASTAVIYSAHLSLCIDPINTFGTEEQKKRLLPDLTAGRKLGCFGLSEPQSGSDAHNMLTKAVLKGDKWIVNGTKNFITNGREAGVCILICKADTGTKTGHIALVVDREESPFTSGKPEDKMGIRGSSTTTLMFEDCEVPAANLLGRIGGGFKIAMDTLDGGRIGIAAQALGIAQGALELAVKYSKERKAFDQKVADFQGIQWFIAEMAMKVEAARLLTYKASWLKSQDEDYTTAAAMAKLFASENSAYVVSKAVQIHGGYGYVTEYDVERMYRDQRITEIYEGTSEIQRAVIAKTVLRQY